MALNGKADLKEVKINTIFSLLVSTDLKVTQKNANKQGLDGKKI